MRRTLLLIAITALLATAILAPGAATRAEGCTYTVRGGDRLADIARQFGTEVQTLQVSNGDQYPAIWTGTLQPGWVLSVPCLGEGENSPPAGSSVTALPQTNLNMRSAPRANSAIVGVLIAWEPVHVVGRNPAGDWLLIDKGATRGWIAAWLTVIRGDMFTVPVVEGTGPVGPPQPVGTPVPQPTSTPRPAITPIPTATGPVPTPASGAGNPPYHIQLSNVGPHLRSIYLRGRQLGNNSGRFSKVGDSETDNPFFVTQFDLGEYDLGAYGYLGGMVRRYRGSFVRDSYATEGGFVISALLDPIWADPDRCRSSENALECEYRLYKPAVALILVRTYPDETSRLEFEDQLREVIEISIARGVIPVISTVPHIPFPAHIEQDMNYTIRNVANEYGVPLWDLWATTYPLFRHGVGLQDHHLVYPEDLQAANFTGDYLDRYGANVRNLEALEALHSITTQVMR